ncbi:hypothetical protein TrRE_jg10517 [Triparma retinervis]|uniref:Uncharacterized protein n=1 Tax=Triparma retinervis TaxID=2557542 RepID=A0A9W7A194_9STRA|nr:hypothetical protein TrRE_jg10517 [Triparma retinervis]
MCYAGPVGRDLGILAAFPISCALSHAVSGHPDCAYDALRFVEVYWSKYLEKRSETEGPEKAAQMYRNAVGWTGVFLSFYVLQDIHLEFLPLSSGSEDFAVVKDSLGVLTLKLLNIGFGRRTSLSTLTSLKSEFTSAVDGEIMHVQQTPSGRRPSRTRRSSLLRSSGVVVSDTGMQVPKGGTLRGKVMAVVAMGRIGKGIKGIFKSDGGGEEEGGGEKDGEGKKGGEEEGEKGGGGDGRNGSKVARFFTSF